MKTRELSAQERSRLKQRLKREAGKLDINLIGFANVERWPEQAEIAEAYWPHHLLVVEQNP